AARSNAAGAIADARAAAADDPLAYQPHWLLADIYRNGDPAAARAELARAVALQPANAVTWYALAEFDLQRHRVRSAVAELHRGLALDPSYPDAAADVAVEQAEVAGTATGKPHRARRPAAARTRRRSVR
ncbi:MAG: tetratricopeptide repeat protein, partial [Solirubrobacteraceae bacterium]